MRGKKIAAVLMAAAMVLSFAACANAEGAVYVQSVKDLAALGGIAPGDRFAGLVVSENVAQINKDNDKSIAELLVREGDDVTEGQELFSYDTESLQLTLNKQQLEQEQLTATIDNYKDQIADLERDSRYVGAADKLQYTVQIQSLQVDLKEAELNINAKKTEIARSETVLENVEVTSPVTGRVQSINESGTDSYGNPAAYITIQQAGSYRIKGTMGELQMGAIMEGVRVKILSRTDETKFWTGTVTLVDYESATQGSDMDMYYGVATDPMSSSSKYPFYVELDSTEGLLLGQHVYIQVDTGDEEISGLSLSSFFVVWDEDGSTYVWAERNSKLEKRPVVLGDYDPMTDTYLVLEGLSETDYIAFPDPEICVEGAPATREMEGEVAMP